MPCYNPLNAIKNVDKWKVRKDGEKYRPILVLPLSQKNNDTFFQTVDYETGEYVESFKIPCGRCLGCRLDYSRAWANRMTLQSITMDEDVKPNLYKLFENPSSVPLSTEFEPWFITFTYDNDHLKLGDWSDSGFHPTLFQKDFQDFMKRLRMHLYRAYGYTGNLKYYYAGEYGDYSMRPHYHAIIWNLPLFNLKQYATTKLGDILYNDNDITSLWSHGHVVIAKATYQTAAYTARYVMKKQNMKYSEQCELFAQIGIQPPYVRMSRRPGIGIEFYEKHKDGIYLHDLIQLPAIKKGYAPKIKPPKIFDTKYGEEFPKELALIKMERNKAQQIAESNLLRTSALAHDCMAKYLTDCEEKKEKDIMSLRREL